MHAEDFCCWKFSEVNSPENKACMGKEDRENNFFGIYQVIEHFLSVLRSQVVIWLDFASH